MAIQTDQKDAQDDHKTLETTIKKKIKNDHKETQNDHKDISNNTHSEDNIKNG